MLITSVGFASKVLSSASTLEALAQDVAEGRRFTARAVSRRGGRTRLIHVPDGYLGMYLKKCAEVLTSLAPAMPPHVFGFVKRRNIVGNARAHLAKPVVLRMDLEDFFPSVTVEQVSAALQAIEFDEGAANMLSSLVTVDGRLPIGFHTSPILSNLVFSETDAALEALAELHGYKFTRYADDLTFSGLVRPGFITEVETLLSDHGWTVNKQKTKLMKKGGKQFVTGLSVSDPTRPRLPLHLKKRMRLKVYLIGRFGFDHYLRKLGGEEHGDSPRSLIGMARHMASVEPKLGDKYLPVLYAAADEYWASASDEFEPHEAYDF